MTIILLKFRIFVFKKDDRNSKENYRLVSILPNMSKIFVGDYNTAKVLNICV